MIQNKLMLAALPIGANLAAYTAARRALHVAEANLIASLEKAMAVGLADLLGGGNLGVLHPNDAAGVRADLNAAVPDLVDKVHAVVTGPELVDEGAFRKPVDDPELRVLAGSRLYETAPGVFLGIGPKGEQFSGAHDSVIAALKGLAS